MTPFSYAIISILLFTITLTVFINKRMNRESSSSNGCFLSVYIACVVFAAVSLFMMTFVIFTSQTYAWIAYPKYQATVVDVNSEWKKQDYKDKNGFVHSKDVEMHTAVLEFYDGSGNLVRMDNNIRSTKRPTVGNQLTIAYFDGKQLSEFSFGSMLMLLALATIMIALGLFSTLIVLYAFNKSIRRVKNFTWGYVLYFVIPAGMFFMMLGMLYALWNHYANNGEMPVLVQLIVMFFSIVLCLALLAYPKSAVEEMRKRTRV